LYIILLKKGWLMKVIVGSKNPVKIEAVKIAFSKMFKNEKFEVVGISADSKVSDQPKSDEETYLGAYNRALYCQDAHPEADYFVGLEGGVEEFAETKELAVTGWVVVVSKDGMVGKSGGGLHFLPDAVAKLIREGYELGEADDIVFKQSNSKQKMGSIGILTGGIITRADDFVSSIVKALIPHKNEGLY
jgi:inosine/xanthosine triphosphatase